MRALLIGATGLVGKALLTHWRSHAEAPEQIVAVGSADADIRDDRAISELLKSCRPDWTLLAAAYTDVDGCERDPERAHAVNAVGTANVARACRDFGSRLLFISTDYVFDGTKTQPYEPDDPIRPISVYGHSKADGEDAVRQFIPDACIVRTSWVYGLARPGFPGAILDQAERMPVVPVIADQIGAPTFAPDLAAILTTLMRAGAQGTLHAVGAGGCTRMEWAQQILNAAGKETVLLQPVTTPQANRPAPRPAYSVLSTASLAKYGIRARRWQESVADYVARRQSTQLLAKASL